MKTKVRYFTETFYNMDDYKDFISKLSHDEDEIKLISVVEIHGNIILTIKQVYIEL